MVISQNLLSYCGKFESTFADSFSILNDCSYNSRPTPIAINHVVLALAHEGMQQSAFVGRRGLTPAASSRDLLSLELRCQVSPYIMWAPRKTTPRQDHALLRMVQRHRFISAWALTVRMRNLYGMRAVQKTINNHLFPVITVIFDPQGNTCWLPTNHRCIHLKWVQRWQNLTGWWKAYGMSFTRWALLATVPGLSGPSWWWFGTRLGSFSQFYRGILRNSIVPFASQHFGDNY